MRNAIMWCIMVGIMVGVAAAAATTTTTTGVLVDPPCQDNEHYKSRLGLSCQSHALLDCFGFSAIGFTLEETNKLLSSCPQSCRVSPCRLDSTTTRTTSTTRELSSLSLKPQSLQRRLQLDGFTCLDDATYVSKIGLTCADHKTVDCRQFNMIGFSEYEVFELMNHCPESCNVDCGTWTLGPTEAPTESPTSSRAPSNSPTKSPHPTVIPSSAPSLAPSEIPTSKPSVAPSMAPSHEPSVTPTASMEPSSPPSGMPSSPPSAIPSVVPSSSPTLVPSQAPSWGPSTVPSQAPSPIPSASPSEMPHDAPTVSPSHKPTVAPSHKPTGHPSASPSSAPSMPTISPTNAPTPGRKLVSTTISLPLEMQRAKVSMSSQDAHALQSTARSFLQENHAVTENVTVLVTVVKIVSHSVAMGPSLVAAGTNDRGNQSSLSLSLGAQHRMDPHLVQPTTVRLFVSGEVSPWNPPSDFAFASIVANGFRNGFGDFLQELHNASTSFQPMVFYSPQEDRHGSESSLPSSTGAWNETAPSSLGAFMVLAATSLLVVILSAFCFSRQGFLSEPSAEPPMARGKKLVDPYEENSMVPSTGVSSAQLLIAAGATNSSTYGEGEDSIPTVHSIAGDRQQQQPQQPQPQPQYRPTFGAFMGPFHYLYRSRTQSTQGSNAIPDSLSESYSQDCGNEI